MVKLRFGGTGFDRAGGEGVSSALASVRVVGPLLVVACYALSWQPAISWRACWLGMSLTPVLAGSGVSLWLCA